MISMKNEGYRQTAIIYKMQQTFHLPNLINPFPSMTRREVTEDEVILLITKYLEVGMMEKNHHQENGYLGSAKLFRKENRSRSIDYSDVLLFVFFHTQMDSIHDLKWVINDYFRLKEEELARQTMSYSIAQKIGPDISHAFQQLEVGFFSGF